MKNNGFTLLEIVAASVTIAVVTSGTFMAYVAASRMTRAQNEPGVAEANLYARETIERFRNLIACDSPWFDLTTCNPSAGLPTAWTADPLPVSAGSQSILNTGASRCYRVTSQDCDGIGGVDDCLAVEVRVCWNGDPCPC